MLFSIATEPENTENHPATGSKQGQNQPLLVVTNAGRPDMKASGPNPSGS